MKKLILALAALFALTTEAAYSPQTLITDPTSGLSASVVTNGDGTNGVKVSLPAATVTTLTPLATITATQGNSATLGAAWPHTLTDGYRGPVAVKAASTAAVATDQALVVAISPNTSITASSSQGASATLGAAWPHTLTDGYRGPVAVKAASTAAVAADPSLVVALSPTSGVTQGSSATLGAAWPHTLTDGYRGPVAVKAASTAAVAADQSLVVSLSPNNGVTQGSSATLGAAWPHTITDGFRGPVMVKSAGASAVATDQALVVTLSPNSPITAPILPNGLLSTRQSITGTESSLAAPANSVGVILECESGNSDNIRWGFSKTAGAILSTTLGILCEPGRDSGYLPFGAGSFLHMISVTSVATDYVDVQWVLSQ